MDPKKDPKHGVSLVRENFQNCYEETLEETLLLNVA